MSLVKRNHFVFPTLVNDFFKPDWFGGLEHFNSNHPAVNIKNNDKGFELELALPGFKKEDVNIEVDNEVLTISSEVKNENETNSGYSRREFSATSFKRVFTLPETIDEGKINAHFENGVLLLTLPKKEEALPKPKRLIEIG